MFFYIGCDSEIGLAQAETCCSIKQNRIQLCLYCYYTLCIELLNKTTEYHTSKWNDKLVRNTKHSKLYG